MTSRLRLTKPQFKVLAQAVALAEAEWSQEPSFAGDVATLTRA